MKPLHLYPTTEIDVLAWPKKIKGLSLDSPALNFFTDFQEVKPLVIESAMTALEVKQLMQKAHVRLKFVLDESDNFIGIVSTADLADEKIMQQVSQGNDRDSILLTDIMTLKKDLKALDYQEIVKASISEVIQALKDSGEQHCLVLDRSAHKVRGIFSASDIARKLHLPIDIQDKSSFYKVFSSAL